MGGTFHAWAAEDYAAQLQQTEDGRRLLALYQERLTQPDLRSTAQAVGQPAGGWTPGQVAALGQVQDLLLDGRLTVLLIPVGRAPSQPADTDADRAALKALAPVFTTLVHDPTEDYSEGLFAWHTSLVHQVPGGWASSAPLSIGHTEASRTLLHLTDKAVLARWPHGSEDVWLFGFDRFTSWFEWREQSFTHLLTDGDNDQ